MRGANASAGKDPSVFFRSLPDNITDRFGIIGDGHDGTNLHSKITQFTTEIVGVFVLHFARKYLVANDHNGGSGNLLQHAILLDAFDDVETKCSLNHFTDRIGFQGEGCLVKFRYHHSSRELAQHPTLWSRRSI